VSSMNDFRTPPAIADLMWTGHTAPATPAFWDFYNVGRSLCRSVGISVTRDSSWTVVYDPTIANDERTSAVIGEINAKLREAGMTLEDRQRIEAERTAERQAAYEAWKSEQAELAARRKEIAEQQFRHRQAEAIEKARACLSRFGEFAAKKQLLRDAVTNPAETLADAAAIGKVLDAVAETDVKHTHQLFVAKHAHATLQDVDWPDEVIEAAVIALTARDHDHACEDNRIGWSKSTSSPGHWCRMMLAEDRRIAIKVARGIVGRHRRQLIEAGILHAPLFEDRAIYRKLNRVGSAA